jgi:UDP-N-acetylglucosamine 2-epimerase (non-hydrolysing)
MSEAFFAKVCVRRLTTSSARARAPMRCRPSRVTAAFEPLVAELAPDVVVVVGDVNSTLRDRSSPGRSTGSSPTG